MASKFLHSPLGQSNSMERRRGNLSRARCAMLLVSFVGFWQDSRGFTFKPFKQSGSRKTGLSSKRMEVKPTVTAIPRNVPFGYDSSLKGSVEGAHVLPAAYRGPFLHPDAEIVAGVSLAELGLDLCIATSTVAPAGLGLFVKLAESNEDSAIDQVTLPAMTLLCGYAKEGTFETRDTGDKTVGFLLNSPENAVFFNRQLMTILDALLSAEPDESGDESTSFNLCGLAGHAINVLENKGATLADQIQIESVDDGFPRYFVPQGMNSEGEERPEYTITEFGQFGNDLAWDFTNPPLSKDEYLAKSGKSNVLQLIWRMEHDPTMQRLQPSWPVTVVKQDITFDNADEFMELGTQYGWAYWQATVELAED